MVVLTQISPFESVTGCHTSVPVKMSSHGVLWLKRNAWMWQTDVRTDRQTTQWRN